MLIRRRTDVVSYTMSFPEVGTKERLYQTITLVLMVLFLGSLEHRLPGHAVDRRWELSLNILTLLVVIVAGEMWKTILLTGFNSFGFQSFFYLPSLWELPAELKIFLGVVLADFCLYWVHRFMHRKALLWRTHVFHHSIKGLWWLSGARTSLMHLLLFALPQILLGYYVRSSHIIFHTEKTWNLFCAEGKSLQSFSWNAP